MRISALVPSDHSPPGPSAPTRKKNKEIGRGQQTGQLAPRLPSSARGVKMAAHPKDIRVKVERGSGKGDANDLEKIDERKRPEKRN